MTASSADLVVPLPPRVQRLLLLVTVLTFGYFVWLTCPARLTHTDDVDHFNAIREHRFEAFAADQARAQGRFHFSSPLHAWTLQVHAIRSDLAFAVVRALFFFTQVGLAGWLAARLTGAARTGWLVALCLAASLHFPATYFAALGYPTLWVGFTALLAGLHCHLTFLRTERRGAAACSGIAFLVACMMQELFWAFLPVFIALSLHAGRRSPRALLRANLPQLAAAAMFIAVYLLFSRLYPSGYGGTQLNFNLRETANVMLRHTAGILPGFEMLVHRGPTVAPGPFFKSADEFRAAFAGTPWFAGVLAALQAVTAYVLLAAKSPVARPGWILILAAVAFALIPNGVIGLTKTHQMLAYYRTYPYAYSFYTFCGFGIAAGLVWERLAGEGRRGPALAAAGLCLLAFASATVSNHYTIGLLHQWYNS